MQLATSALPPKSPPAKDSQPLESPQTCGRTSRQTFDVTSSCRPMIRLRPGESDNPVDFSPPSQETVPCPMLSSRATTPYSVRMIKQTTCIRNNSLAESIVSFTDKCFACDPPSLWSLPRRRWVDETGAWLAWAQHVKIEMDPGSIPAPGPTHACAVWLDWPTPGRAPASD